LLELPPLCKQEKKTHTGTINPASILLIGVSPIFLPLTQLNYKLIKKKEPSQQGSKVVLKQERKKIHGHKFYIFISCNFIPICVPPHGLVRQEHGIRLRLAGETSSDASTTEYSFPIPADYSD